MLLTFLQLMILLLKFCNAHNINEISSDNHSGRIDVNTTDFIANYNDYGDLNDFREYENSTINISLDTFFKFVVNVSKQQIKNVHRNIKRDYHLNDTEVRLLDIAFKDCDWDYWLTINRYLKKMVSNVTDRKKFSLSDFTDFSHFLLQKIIENNLDLVEGGLTLPTMWSEKPFKQKILRQQMKIVMNIIDSQICWKLSLCIKHNVYTDYVVEWLRYLLSASSLQLDALFANILPSLDKFMHVIRTNVKFRHKIKYVVQRNASARMDFIDFVDEIFTNQDEIIQIMPPELKRSAELFIDLFQLIDDNYNLNGENEIQLKNTSKMLLKWANGENINIEDIIETVVHNMELNTKIWPLPEQNRLDYIWLEILNV